MSLETREKRNKNEFLNKKKQKENHEMKKLLCALLAALTSNLLFRWLKDSGVSLLAGGAASLLFGGVLYLAALSAQGVYLSQVFRLRK